MSWFRRFWESSDELFEEFYREFLSPSWDASERSFEPLVQIEDREKEVVVTVDLPYVERREDVEVNVTEDEVTIKAKLKCDIQWERWGTIQKHIKFNSFRKVVRLPSKVDPEGARAIFRRGILVIILPKIRRVKRVKVD